VLSACDKETDGCLVGSGESGHIIWGGNGKREVGTGYAVAWYMPEGSGHPQGGFGKKSLSKTWGFGSLSKGNRVMPSIINSSRVARYYLRLGGGRCFKRGGGGRNMPE